ncbi:MAG: VOC family protein [Burkholderiales bacterium]|nr:VOC family protein [Burkholderiales bacterium]
MTACRLVRIVIGCADPRACEVYRAICGAAPEVDISPDGTARYSRFHLDDAVIALAEPRGAGSTGQGGEIAERIERLGPGVHVIVVAAAELSGRVAEIEAAGVSLLRRDGELYVDRCEANGVRVQLTQLREARPRPGDARLDHVAIRVRDLARAGLRWQAITGARAQMMGIHPISGGTFSATRFELGERMVELVSPVASKPSALAERLASHGEGIAALALPAKQIEVTLERLRAAGARVFRQEPHWMVHPKDAAGVLVQLTPRVRHL